MASGGVVTVLGKRYGPHWPLYVGKTESEFELRVSRFLKRVEIIDSAPNKSAVSAVIQSGPFVLWNHPWQTPGNSEFGPRLKVRNGWPRHRRFWEWVRVLSTGDSNPTDIPYAVGRGAPSIGSNQNDFNSEKLIYGRNSGFIESDGNVGTIASNERSIGILLSLFRGLESQEAKNNLEECCDKKGTRERRNRVCPELLPPPLIAFGFAIALIACGLYVQGLGWERAARQFYAGWTIYACGIALTAFGWFGLFFGDWWSPIICWLW